MKKTFKETIPEVSGFYWFVSTFTFGEWIVVEVYKGQCFKCGYQSEFSNQIDDELDTWEWGERVTRFCHF